MGEPPRLARAWAFWRLRLRRWGQRCTPIASPLVPRLPRTLRPAACAASLAASQNPIMAPHLERTGDVWAAAAAAGAWAANEARRPAFAEPHLMRRECCRAG